MTRGTPTVVAAVLAGVVLAGCGGSKLSLPCEPQPYAALCIKVFHDGGTVKDVIAYRASSVPGDLAHTTWQLVLTAGGRSYPGLTRHGNPPFATFCRDSSGNTVTTPTGCHDTLASAYASFGDFPGLRLPRTFPSGTRFCVSEEIFVGGEFRPNGKPKPACATS